MTSRVELGSRGCGLCGSTSARELYTAKDRLSNTDNTYTIVECGECRVLRTLPELSDAELERFYPNDYWGGRAEPSERWIKSSQSEKTAFLSRCGLTSGTILDVGCGSGFFLRALDRAKWDRFGVETGEAACRNAKASLGSDRVSNGTLMAARLKDEFFDVVTFWSALEHTNQPRENLNEARRIIKKGGTLIVQLPNAASYQARLFAGDWFALDAPRHRYHFTLPVLQRLLSDTGFEVYRASYFSKEHNSHSLRQSLKTKLGMRDSKAISYLRFYLSLAVIKPIDQVMSAFGKGATLTVAARAL